MPVDLVPRTARAYLSIIGDPMGPAMNNLDNLVQLPTGCGEQNMVKFAPLISVTRYLKETSQLDNKMSSLTQEYMKVGKLSIVS